MLPIEEWALWHWVAACGVSLVVGWLLGFIFGRRGNSTRPLNRIAKSAALIAKQLGDKPSE